jgi:predicted nuclease with TOPRIM domain
MNEVKKLELELESLKEKIKELESENAALREDVRYWQNQAVTRM